MRKTSGVSSLFEGEIAVVVLARVQQWGFNVVTWLGWRVWLRHSDTTYTVQLVRPFRLKRSKGDFRYRPCND